MKKTSFSVIILALIFATTNCVSSPKSDTPVVIPVTSHTSPIITSTNSATSIPTSTAIPSPTWTPIPTLSSTEAELMVASLLESNGGCKLPCWWGAIPGQTSWDEVEQFLNMFITRVEQGQAGTSLEDDGDHFYTNYSAEYIVLGQASKGRILYDVRDGVIVGISVDPPGNEFSYQLHQLLSSYGQPQAVYILTYPNVPFEILPFRILAHYPTQGFYAIYEYPARNDGNTISSCPDSRGPSLYLESLNQPYEKYLTPFEDSAKRLMGVNENAPLVDLQTATLMDAKTFYETFKNPTDICLKTPANLWQ